MAVWLIAGLEEYLEILVTADSTYKFKSYNCLYLVDGPFHALWRTQLNTLRY